MTPQEKIKYLENALDTAHKVYDNLNTSYQAIKRENEALRKSVAELEGEFDSTCIVEDNDIMIDVEFNASQGQKVSFTSLSTRLNVTIIQKNGLFNQCSISSHKFIETMRAFFIKCETKFN